MRPERRSTRTRRSKGDDDSEKETDEGKEDEWSSEENMKLIRQVLQQIPKNDDAPYDDRKKKIEWKSVTIKNRTTKQIMAQFDKLLTRTRNYRLLSEMLKDVEKESISLKLPKKPISSFALYLKDQSAKIKEQLASKGESLEKGCFVRLASETYKNLNTAEKHKYQKMADDLKKNYYGSLNKCSLDGKKKGSRRSDMPKVPCTLFTECMMGKDRDLTHSEARRMYIDLSREEKLKWILRLLEVKNGDKLSLEQHKMAVDTLTREEISIIDEYEGRPSKLSAYNCFAKVYLDELKENKTGNSLSPAEKWKTLSKAKRKRYKEIAQKEKIDYDNKYIEFIEKLEPNRQLFEANAVLKKSKNKGGKTSTLLNHSALSVTSHDSDHGNESAMNISDENSDNSEHENGSTMDNKRNSTRNDENTEDCDHESLSTKENKEKSTGNDETAEVCDRGSLPTMENIGNNTRNDESTEGPNHGNLSIMENKGSNTRHDETTEDCDQGNLSTTKNILMSSRNDGTNEDSEHGNESYELENEGNDAQNEEAGGRVDQNEKPGEDYDLGNESTLENIGNNTPSDKSIEILAVFTTDVSGKDFSTVDFFSTPFSEGKQKSDISNVENPSSSEKAKRTNENIASSEKMRCVKRNIYDSSVEPSPKRKKRRNLAETEFCVIENFPTHSEPVSREHNHSISNSESMFSLSSKKEENKLSPSASELEVEDKRSSNDLPNSSLNTSSHIFNQQPPSSVFQYYVKEVYKGSPLKAQQTYKQLSLKQKKKLHTKYRKAKEKYTKMFRKHLETLTSMEIKEFMTFMKHAQGSEEETDNFSE